jgi:ubiquinone/menaquinone biosynthesis C-methylase UbiE
MRDADEHASRAASFGSVGGEYERGRPSYPAEAVAWLVGTDPLQVIDLGAGTGKLTRRLLELGHDVVAVEPAKGMLEQLEAELPAATTVDGTAEAIPLPDGQADAVVAGQAFHWFDAERALPEIARVLRPAGRLGLV